MYPALKLTEIDLKDIAHHRATRFVERRQRSNKKMVAAEWFGFIGLLLTVIPIIISQIKNTPTSDGVVVILGMLLVLLFIFSWVRIPGHRKIEKAILDKWGIKNKKGKRWASE